MKPLPQGPLTSSLRDVSAGAAYTRYGHAAFTLIELLVAMFIALILAGLLLSIVRVTLTLGQRTQDNLSAAVQAKLAFDLLERDLQSALFRLDGKIWLAVEINHSPSYLSTHGWLALTGLTKPNSPESQRLAGLASAPATPLISSARFGLSGAWLRLMTTNDEVVGGLPVAVAYQIARRPVSGAVSSGNPAAVRYTLFRAAVSAANSFAVGADVTAPGYGNAAVAPAASRNSATLTNPNSTDALATNVVDFGLWLYVRDLTAGGLRRIFPGAGNDLTHTAVGSAGVADAHRFPVAVDVMMRILTESGATLVAEIESGAARVSRPPNYSSDAEWWWAIVETHSQVYTRRIELKAVGW
jgi:prepilin-type N-terminal cleavage/methylation domain-containing protein